jgi:hypothetical protein
MEDVTIRPTPFLDPRGAPRFAPLALAQRLGDLAGRTVLLFDNGKLAPTYGAYAALFDVFAAALAERGARVVRAARDLLAVGDRTTLRAIADAVVAPLQPDAVVLAYGDAGVTHPTTFLAVELEGRGMPTALVCAPLGATLAATMAASYAPGLPVLRLGALRSAPPEAVAAEAATLVDELVRALTVQPAVPAAAAALGPRLAADDGTLRLAAERRATVRDGVAELDPGAFAEDVYTALLDAGLGDGFPVIPPTPERVAAMLRFAVRPPEHALLAECTPSGAAITVERLAVCAVMAGCTPEYFPIVLTAMEAMCQPRYRLPWAVVTTHPAGNAVLVSGPLAAEIGLQAGHGCLGPGFRANATIGRALTLCQLLVCRAVPGRSDLSAMGSPAEYSYCFAENLAESPWPGRHVDLYDAETTCVTVAKVEGPHNLLDHLSTTPEGILDGLASVAATLGANNAYYPAELLLILNPEHAAIIASAGWSKADVRSYVYERARNPRAQLQGRGIVPNWPRWFQALERVPVVTTPEEIIVVVAGGAAPQSMVALPWGFSRAVTLPVRHADGRPVRSVYEIGG